MKSKFPQGGDKSSYPPTMSHRVDIDAPSDTVDANGDRAPGWVPFAASVPAAFMPVSGSEFVSQSGEQFKVTARFVIPVVDGVLPVMRLRHLGVPYNIRAVLPDPTTRMHITLMVESGANDG